MSLVVILYLARSHQTEGAKEQPEVKVQLVVMVALAVVVQAILEEV
jgi:hypothetical protein